MMKWALFEFAQLKSLNTEKKNVCCVSAVFSAVV